ncbi:MAG: BON domain-containing protein [Desulfovibrio sp.]|nr:BON domain-containing protein [Desulfovibrio sp.]
MHTRPFPVLLLLLAVLLLHGCAYGILDDKRLLDTMSQDKALASNIKSALMKKDFAKGFSISVYSYYKHVFLVGELPESFQKRAQAIAQSKNPRSVTCHWFTPAKNADSDFILSGRLRTALIGAKDLSSTRVDTEINAGRVVLLGVVGNEQERKIAIKTARKVDGVVNVTSYLMLPPHSHQPNTQPTKELAAPSKQKP